MVDHRVPYDLNYAINKRQFSKPWRFAMKHLWIPKIIEQWPILTSIYIPFVAFFILIADAEIRERTQGSKAISYRNKEKIRNLEYIINHDNKNVDTGRWNHNFSCWENDPECGRDFD